MKRYPTELGPRHLGKILGISPTAARRYLRLLWQTHQLPPARAIGVLQFSQLAQVPMQTIYQRLNAI